MAPLFRVVALVLGALVLLQIGLVAGAPGSGQFAAANGDLHGNTTMRIGLQADGDARWTVTMTVSLEDQAAVQAFRATGSAFEAGNSDVLSIETFRNFATRASQATGRVMSLDNVTREATVHNATGRLELSFTWTNFGHTAGESLYVGDVFESPTGTWLDGLAANQYLVIEAPDNFEITSAPKGFTNKTIRWEGPTEFDPSHLSVKYHKDATTRTPTPTSTANTTRTPTQTGTTIGSVDNSGPIWPIVTLMLLLIAGAGGLYVYRRGDFSLPDDADTSAASSTGNEDAEDAARAAVDEPDDEPDDESGDEFGAGPLPDRELLSDEEYVEALLERNGGRMKQAEIVSETDWSNAKVSQLLSSMADADRVEKLRIGRENLISLPDFEDEE